jgi:hypothetical protein
VSDPGKKRGGTRSDGKSGEEAFWEFFFFFFHREFFLRPQSSGYTVHEEGGDVVHLKRQLKLMAVL